MLAKWIGAPMEEITYLCAGINHQAFYLRFERNGKDAYPALRAAMENPAIYNEEQVRNEMFLHLGYYVTESSGHNSEYNAWFRKRPDLIEKYCTHGTGWNPGKYAYILEHYLEREHTWKEETRQWLAKNEPIDLKRGHEYAASIFDALFGSGQTFEFNGNVLNDNLVDNLPQGCCVEVPVFATRRGLDPIHVGKLPPQCAALVNISANNEEMAVEASLTGNPAMVFHSIAYDPLTSAVCSLAEIRSMVKELFEVNRDYLPQFKTVDF
jgi:alpha-galactosidase